MVTIVRVLNDGPVGNRWTLVQKGSHYFAISVGWDDWNGRAEAAVFPSTANGEPTSYREVVVTSDLENAMALLDDATDDDGNPRPEGEDEET